MTSLLVTLALVALFIYTAPPRFFREAGGALVEGLRNCDWSMLAGPNNSPVLRRLIDEELVKSNQLAERWLAECESKGPSTVPTIVA